MNKSLDKTRASARLFSTFGKIALASATIYTVRKLAARRLPGESAQPDSKLRGKIVLITGGSRGLGLALAFELGARGCRLALCARNEEELNEACRRLAEKNVEAVPFAADVSDANETGPLINRVIERLGRVDVLVNDAGEIQVAPINALTKEDFESAMNLMFWAPVSLSLAVLPHMTDRRSGYIVNITSIGGRVSVPHLLPYSCAKFACVGFSTGLAAEVKSRGVHVLTVVPGLMRTGSYLHAKFGGKAKQEFTWFALLGNMPGVSIAADAAARQIITALEQKRYNCTISFPAKMLVGAEALLPNMTRTIMSYVNAILPGAKGPTPQSSGKELNPQLNSVFQAFTTLGKQAARTFNE